MNTAARQCAPHLAGGNIFLVGPMGVGKTAVGRQLAKRLKKAFWDSDREIERRTGVDIATIFAYEGESGFRKREHAMLEELSALDNVVLSTGGGSVIDPRNRKLLAERGFVVFLRACLDTLQQRTLRDRKRPLLQTEDPRARLEALLREREPLYREIADLTVNTDCGSIASAAARITRSLRGRKPAALNTMD